MNNGLGKMVEYVNHIVKQVEKTKKPKRVYEIWFFHTNWSEETHIMRQTVVNEAAKKLRDKGFLVAKQKNVIWDYSNANILFIRQKMNLRLLGECIWDFPRFEERRWTKVVFMLCEYFSVWNILYNFNEFIAEKIF